MAKIKVLNDVAVINSTVKLVDLERVAKYRPEALKVYESDGEKKKLVFKVSVTNDDGCINEFSVSFGKETRTGGLATVNFTIPAKTEDVKEYLADKYGAALNYLAQIEGSIPGVIAEINAARDAIKADIEIDQ